MKSDTQCRDQLTTALGSTWEASQRVIVIDNGAGHIKAGFAEEASPSLLLPCIVGRALQPQHTPNHRAAAPPMQPCTRQAVAVGSACLAQQAQLQSRCPMSSGMVTHWEDMSLLWDQAFYDQLQLDPEGCKVLLTHAAHCPAANRRRALEEVFENYGFAAASLQPQPMLALYAQGCVSGLVIDAGHSMTSVVAVVEGVVFPSVTKHLHVAGRQVTQHLMELLQRKGHALGQAKDFDSVNRIKEAHCYVAPDNARELKLARETTFVNRSFTLPDGKTIRVAAERFQAAEALFDPSLLDIEGPGIAEAAFDAIQQMDMDNRRCLYEHVVLTGGTTMLPGLPTRVEKEIRSHYLEKILHGDKAGLTRLRLKLSDPPNRRHLAWVGGAVLADLMKDQADFWISKQEYEEDPHRALKKCY